MDGVTVLQTIPAFHFPICLAICITLFGLIIIGAGAYALDVFFHFVLVIGMVILGIGIMCIKEPHPERYKITINDNVSYNEFVEHYNIIETDGEILIVEEK